MQQKRTETIEDGYFAPVRSDVTGRRGALVLCGLEEGANVVRLNSESDE